MEQPVVVLSGDEMRVIKQMRDHGKRRCVEGEDEVLVFMPVSFWVPGTDAGKAAIEAGALLEERLCSIAWDEGEFGKAVEAEKKRRAEQEVDDDV